MAALNPIGLYPCCDLVEKRGNFGSNAKEALPCLSRTLYAKAHCHPRQLGQSIVRNDLFDLGGGQRVVFVLAPLVLFDRFIFGEHSGIFRYGRHGVTIEPTR